MEKDLFLLIKNFDPNRDVMSTWNHRDVILTSHPIAYPKKPYYENN